MDVQEFSKLMQLSPFEVKNTLIAQASSHPERMMLNAGRGNPNWVATVPRHGFWQLGLFAMTESQRFLGHIPEGVGGLPEQGGHRGAFRDLRAKATRTYRGALFSRRPWPTCAISLGCRQRISCTRWSKAS